MDTRSSTPKNHVVCAARRSACAALLLALASSACSGGSEAEPGATAPEDVDGGLPPPPDSSTPDASDGGDPREPDGATVDPAGWTGGQLHLSNDGRFVAVVLHETKGNGATSYVLDREQQTFRCLDGTLGLDEYEWLDVMSDDGRFAATNRTLYDLSTNAVVQYAEMDLLPVDIADVTNGGGHILGFGSGAQAGYPLLFDLSEGTSVRIASTLDGAPPNDVRGAAELTPDGRFAVFDAAASNWVDGDTNGVHDLFVVDTNTATIVASTVQADQGIMSGSAGVGDYALSANGQVLVFVSDSTNLVADQEVNNELYAYDIATGQFERLTRPRNGGATAGAWNPSVSDDGRWVVFASNSEQLVDEPTDGPFDSDEDIFLVDRELGVVERISDEDFPASAPYGGERPTISGDGRFIAYYAYPKDGLQQELLVVERESRDVVHFAFPSDCKP
jgi:hypothetical protein